MASTQAMCTSFKSELLLGQHQISTSTIVSRGSLTAPTADTFKAALYYDATGSLTAATTAFTTTGENSGTGYTTGGVTCVWNAPATSGTTAFANLNASITYSGISTTNAVQAVLIYNNTQTNKAVAVYTFTPQIISSGTLALTMPNNNNNEALLRIA
jgi:hypothetical protein